jgi:site-specific DNA recombinase
MRVAIYVRVSTQRQAQTQTIEQQIERLQVHVEAQGWVLEPEHIYRDDGYSGAKLNRPGLDSLRDRAALAEFDLVLITEPDRLARNYVHQMVVIEELERRGVQVEFLDRPMSDNPHDRLLLQIRGAVAEYERTQISERMRRGRLARYRSGQLLPWTRPPYGYRVNPESPRNLDGVRLDEAEAAIVVQMFDWYWEPQTSLYHVAKRLTDLGLPTPTGKPRWNVATVRGILKNPAYVGTAYTNRTCVAPAKKRKSALQPVGRGESWTPRPEEEWIGISVPAIVTQEVFERVQDKLAHNQQASTRNNKTYNYLLRGLVSCGQCRLGATGRTLPGPYHYYVCRGRTDALRAAQGQRCTARYVPAAQLDELVWQDLCAVLTQPEIIAYALERAHGGHWAPQELQARIRALKQVLGQLERQQERLLEAYLANVITLSEFERKRQELAQKQEALSIQHAQIEAPTTQQVELSRVAASIEAFCAQIRPVLEHATFAQRRHLVELLIDRVIVTDADVEIRYVVPTQPDGPHVPFCHLRKDYLDPHPAAISTQGLSSRGQVGRQQPGFLFAFLPMRQQVGRVSVLERQQTWTQPVALTGLFDHISKWLPVAFGEFHFVIGLLAQHVAPMPDVHLPHDGHCPEFAVSNQQNGRLGRNQPSHVGQQGQLFGCRTVPAALPDPGPGDGDRPSTKGNAHHQQLMPETDFAAIRNQTDFPNRVCHGLQHIPGNRRVPLTHPNRRVVQKATQTPRDAQRIGPAWYLQRHLAQMHRPAPVDAHQQPGKIAQTCDALSRAQLFNPLKPSMIQSVDRHLWAPQIGFGKPILAEPSCWSTLFC